MKNDIRITGYKLQILSQITANPGISGAEITRNTGIPSGVLYPILIKLEKADWITGEWEKSDPSKLGRPRRKAYNITTTGSREVLSFLSTLVGLTVGV